MMQYEYMYNHQQLDSVLTTDDYSICKIRSYDNKFWKGKDILGYHCVVITGFDEFNNNVIEI